MEGSQSPKLTVILLGGWSSGPLEYLRYFLLRNSTRTHIEVVEIDDFPMPPIPSSEWCCDPKVLLMVGMLAGMIYGATRIAHGVASGVGIFFLYLLFVIAVVVWVRVLAAVVVRSSIEKGVQIATFAVRSAAHNGAVLVVGFSWGGAILADFIANNQSFGGSDLPFAMLIAPTTSLVAKISCNADAALRIRGDSGPRDRITVVHGTLDTAFCPDQDRWESAPVSLLRLRDNHVFSTRNSRREITQALSNMIAQIVEQNR